MLLFQKRKDGGKESNVTGYWLVEIKSLFSIVLLRFEGPSRRNFHSHAFNALTWFLSGKATEHKEVGRHKRYKRSFFPKHTPRDATHRVSSCGVSWMLSLRGPWKDTWYEYDPVAGEVIKLTHGRRVVKA